MLGRRSFPTKNGFFFKGHCYPAGNDHISHPTKGEVRKIIFKGIFGMGYVIVPRRVSFRGRYLFSTIHAVESHPAVVQWDFQGPPIMVPLSHIPIPLQSRIPKDMGIVSPIIGGPWNHRWFVVFLSVLLDLGTSQRLILGVYFGLYGSSKDGPLDEHFGPGGWWMVV